VVCGGQEYSVLVPERFVLCQNILYRAQTKCSFMYTLLKKNFHISSTILSLGCYKETLAENGDKIGLLKVLKICFDKAYKQIFPCFFYYPLLKGCYEEMLAENRDTIGLL